MPEPIEGKWWRFSRYEVRDGYIRSAPGAELDWYNPWDHYHAAKRKRPWQALLDLFPLTALVPPGQPPLSSTLATESEARLLTWCAEYGLLGVLLQRAQRIVLAARWTPISMRMGAGGPARMLQPSVSGYTRTSAGWNVCCTTPFGKAPRPYSPENDGQVVAADQLPKGWQRPTVSLGNLRDTGWQEEPLSVTWARFFPDVPPDERETYLYPQPLSEEFWRLYAEPVDAFVDGAMALVQALEQLTHVKQLPVRRRSKEQLRRGETLEPVDLVDEDLQQAVLGKQALEALLAPFRMTLSVSKNGVFSEQWVSPSLLGSLAMMAFHDVVKGRRVLRCKNSSCGKPFLWSRHHPQYCCPKHKATAEKRRQRSRKRKARSSMRSPVTRGRGKTDNRSRHKGVKRRPARKRRGGRSERSDA